MVPNDLQILPQRHIRQSGPIKGVRSNPVTVSLNRYRNRKLRAMCLIGKARHHVAVLAVI